LSDEEKVKELVERIHRLAKKGREVDARMKKLEQVIVKKAKK
jgi:hypothetical protein